ncbi:putative quinol monooxygenase [Aquabacterium humicola]|uniref:putative quinol monooxygenase n=1 Tax=Aquabacterium humicola TaxID=3237377 RepID=UPI002543065E|nr:putative quinol monooxygenase [Rubrivivax pictus]
MIIVLGHAVVREDQLDAALALSHEHVARSRQEPGCLQHGVHIDGERPNRLVFVEQWADMAALQQHFRVPASRAFAKALSGLAAEPVGMALYDAQAIPT